MLYNLYSSPDIIGMIKEYGMARLCSTLETNGKCIQNFGQEAEMKRRPRHRKEVILKWILNKYSRRVFDSINLAQDRDHWQTLMSTTEKCQVHIGREFLH